jgi:hypothetical protein
MAFNGELAARLTRRQRLMLYLCWSDSFMTGYEAGLLYLAAVARGKRKVEDVVHEGPESFKKYKIVAKSSKRTSTSEGRRKSHDTTFCE